MTEEEAKEYLKNHGCCCPFGTSPFNCEDKGCKYGQAIMALLKANSAKTKVPLGHFIERCGG